MANELTSLFVFSAFKSKILYIYNITVCLIENKLNENLSLITLMMYKKGRFGSISSYVWVRLSY